MVSRVQIPDGSPNSYADVAELADALDLGSSVNDMGVRVSSSAPNKKNCGSGSVVERHLAKVNVASSNLVSRSIKAIGYAPLAQLVEQMTLNHWVQSSSL